MAKKKRRPPKKTPKRPGRSRPTHPTAPQVPDRRALEGVMRQLVEGMVGPSDETPLGKAQELMYEAFETPDRRERIAIAHKALEIAPDCTDAYVLLAEEAPSRKEALELYRKGVEAGERVLGPEFFKEAEGDFWGILETRPYMRAKQGLADALWTSGRRDEAVAQLQEMLRLNPNDNQGVRYTLAAWLLAMDRDDDLARLLQQYPDEGSATWAYTKALLAFRREGDTPEARQRLQEAEKINKHVPDYLTGKKPLPGEQPLYYSPGDASEAIIYVGSALAGWKATPGAIAWLKSSRPEAKPKQGRGPKAKGPLPQVKKRLQRRPQEFDTWQADFREMPSWVEVAGERVRPWMMLVASRSNGLVLSHAVFEESPSSDLIWDTLVRAIEKPMTGRAHRPTELQVRSDGRWEALRPHLDEIGITCVAAPALDELDFVFQELGKQMAGDSPPGLLEMPGVTPQQVAGFYRAAADFYRKAPWRMLGYEATIKVACDQFESSPWYAVIMGQSGLTFGVALYDDLNLLKKLWAGNLSDEENARETVALTVTYGDETEIPVSDLEASRQHGWDVAGPDAYPSLFRKERGLSMRPPLAWELELMEGCLRAIPEFVARHPLDDPSPWSITVPTASRELRLVLSWVEQ